VRSRLARFLREDRSQRCAGPASGHAALCSRTLCFEPLETRLLLDGAAAPQNVILMIGDGMGFEQVNAGRMFLGGEIVFDRFPHRGEVTTYSANDQITDSAASATAMATGQKVNNGVISTAIPGDGSRLTTALQMHGDLGRATGLVTTTAITHATPAAFGAHADDRRDVDDIAADLLLQTRPNVLFGGGAEGMTTDGAAAAGYHVITDRGGLPALDTETQTFVSGQFGASHMPYEYDGLGDLPHLSEMTAAALDVLENDPDGFFLMVEGGRIDHAGHVNDIERGVRETAEFTATVELVLDWAAGRADTLILVTADHETGGMSVIQDNGQGVAPEVDWSTSGHTAANVPIYAWGAGAELVGGTLDNTDVFALIAPASAPSDRVRVSLDGSRVTAFGTEGNDLFEIAAGSIQQLVLNGVQHQFEQASEVRLIGGGGSDSAALSGTEADETATLYPNSATMQGLTNEGLDYKVELTGMASIRIDGGGGSDTAWLFDSPGHDKFVGARHYGKLYGEGFSNKALSFQQVHAVASSGGDTAKLYDSPANDRFVATPDYARLQGEDFSVEIEQFNGAHVYATAGGIDVATLYDSPGNDKFVATSYSGALFGDGFYNRAKFFEGVHAYATAGGIDVAKLFDSPGDDHFFATPISAVLFGDGFYNRAKFFDGVHAYATADGIDEAQLFDSPGNDFFHATESEGALFGNGFYNRAKHFEKIHARADAGGADRAVVFDAAIQSGFIGDPIDGSDTALAKMAWLYDFEELYTGSQSSSDPAVQQAVDAILTAYWSR